MINWWELPNNILQSKEIKIDSAFFRKLLKKGLKRKNLNQKELAAKLSVSKALITEWIKGNRKPSIGLLKKLLYILDIDHAFLNDKWAGIKLPYKENDTINFQGNVAGNKEKGYRIRLSPIISKLLKNTKYCKVIIENSREIYAKVSNDGRKKMLYLPVNISKSPLGLRNIKIKGISHDEYLERKTSKYVVRESNNAYTIKLNIGANFNVIIPIDVLRKFRLSEGDSVFLKPYGRDGFFIKIGDRTDFIVNNYRNIGDECYFYLRKTENEVKNNVINGEQLHIPALIHKDMVWINDGNDKIIAGYVLNNSRSKPIKIAKNFELSREFGWFLGFWFAEGSKGKGGFSIFSVDSKIIKYIIEILRKITESRPKIDIYYNANKVNKQHAYQEACEKLENYKLINNLIVNNTYSNIGYEINIHSTNFQRIVRYFSEYVMRNVNKLDFPEQFLVGFVEGVVEGDGSVYTKYKDITFIISEPNPQRVKMYINTFVKLNWIKENEFEIIAASSSTDKTEKEKIPDKTTKIFNISKDRIQMYHDKKSKSVYYGLKVKINKKITEKLYEIKFGYKTDTFEKIKDYLKSKE